MVQARAGKDAARRGAAHPGAPPRDPAHLRERARRAALSRRALAAAAGLVLASACAHPATRPAPPESEELRPSPPGEEPPVGPELGLASYYARSLQGHRTASGGRYDGRAMTCAHRTHAFGTVLRVTELESGRSVLVRVTDRGPFTPGRVVDLSWAAARRLGILDRGVARVRVERAE